MRVSDRERETAAYWLARAREALDALRRPHRRDTPAGRPVADVDTGDRL